MHGTGSIASSLIGRLTSDILNGELRPGERLKIRDLGLRYGTSAIPLREALSRLASQGLVSSENQKGFSVTPISRSDLQDLTQTRIAIECLALRQAIATGDVEWESGIVSAAHRLKRLPAFEQDDSLSPEWEAAHTLFHQSLVSACSSPRIHKMRDDLSDQSRRYRYLAGFSAPRSRKVDNEHDALVKAVLARDPDTACSLLEAHFWATSEQILRVSAID